MTGPRSALRFGKAEIGPKFQLLASQKKSNNDGKFDGKCAKNAIFLALKAARAKRVGFFSAHLYCKHLSCEKKSKDAEKNNQLCSFSKKAKTGPISGLTPS